MSSETTLLIKGTIAELPADQQVRVLVYYERMKAIIRECETEGILAMALLGSELQGE